MKKVFISIALVLMVASSAFGLNSFKEANAIYDEVWEFVSADVEHADVMEKPVLKTSVLSELQFLFLKNSAAMPNLNKTFIYGDGSVKVKEYDIVVSVSLIKTSTPNQFRAILLHEIGHIAMKHSKYRMEYIFKKFGMPKTFMDSVMFIEKINKLAKIDEHYASWCKGQEYDADMYSCQVLEKMGKDPMDMADVLRAISKGITWLEKMDPTHPRSADRIDLIEFSNKAEYFSKSDPEDVIRFGMKPIPVVD